MKNIVKFLIQNVTNPLILAPLLLVILVLAIGILPGTILDSIRSVFGSTPSGQINTGQTVVTNIKPLGQLVSIETQLAKAGIEVYIQRGIADVCQFSAKHVAQGTLQAGIDLTRITEANVRLDNGSGMFHILLPAAQLTSCSLDPVQTQQYTHSGDSPLCPIDWDEVRRLASYVALNEFRDDAIAGGLLERAEHQAEVVLQNFVEALTGNEVVIEFAESEAVSFPQSCSPEPPGKWYFDNELERWLES